MDKQEKLLTSVEKLQSDLDSLKQEIKPQIINNGTDSFRIFVQKVNKGDGQPETSAKLDGDIETI